MDDERRKKSEAGMSNRDLNSKEAKTPSVCRARDAKKGAATNGECDEERGRRDSSTNQTKNGQCSGFLSCVWCVSWLPPILCRPSRPRVFAVDKKGFEQPRREGAKQMHLFDVRYFLSSLRRLPFVLCPTIPAISHLPSTMPDQCPLVLISGLPSRLLRQRQGCVLKPAWSNARATPQYVLSGVRPSRAQKRRKNRWRSDNPTRWSVRTSLRPRTAALR
jgi:hypothetical protein